MNRVGEEESLQQTEEALQKREDWKPGRSDSSEKDAEVYGVATKCRALPYLQNPETGASKACPAAISSKFSEECSIRKDKKTHKKNIYQAE